MKLKLKKPALIKTKPKNKTKPKITKNSNLLEILETYPLAQELLMEYGLQCAACTAAAFDTLEEGVKIHGFSDQEVDELVDYLNKNCVKDT